MRRQQHRELEADGETVCSRVAHWTCDRDGYRADIETELERDLPYNCEHVVPQSWLNKTEPMRGDLHHLFACEARCNSFRGNTPYAEFAHFLEVLKRAIRTDCGKSERNGVEPAFGKGAAARPVFSVTKLPRDRLGVLLAWHEQDPISEWERHRNAAIFARQGNRNPFIDNQEWAAEVISPLD
jgi:endonuclease I